MSIVATRSKPADEAACLAGRHVPAYKTRIDAGGIEHGHCRHCGCELARVPTLRRWYRSGLMG